MNKIAAIATLLFGCCAVMFAQSPNGNSYYPMIDHTYFATPSLISPRPGTKIRCIWMLTRARLMQIALKSSYLPVTQRQQR